MSENVLGRFLKEIECPTCYEYMLNGIGQCLQGHSICMKCRVLLEHQKCPFCFAPFTNGRNYALEKLIESLQFHCEKRNEGCTFQGLAVTIINHQKNDCEYKRFCCPVKASTNCTWLGVIADVKKHMNEGHNAISIFQKGHIKIEFLEYYNCLFKVLHQRTSTRNLEWCVEFVGTEENAAKYMFRLEFIDQSKSGFEAVFTGICTPYGKEEDAFHLEKISIHEDSLKRFKNRADCYNYRITIIQR